VGTLDNVQAFCVHGRLPPLADELQQVLEVEKLKLLCDHQQVEAVGDGPALHAKDGAHLYCQAAYD
jgi:hypothetical protein